MDRFKEIIEMIEVLVDLYPEEYELCKVVALCLVADRHDLYAMMCKIFKIADQRRTRLIELG